MEAIATQKRAECTHDEIIAIKVLFEEGRSQRYIASKIQKSQSTVARTLRRLQLNNEGSTVANTRTGRPSKLDDRAQRRLVRKVKENPFQTLEELSTPSKSGTQLHKTTTRRVLKNNGIRSFKPIQKPYLSAIHQKKRLQWAKDLHNSMLHTQHGNCPTIYTDESSFEVGKDYSSSYCKRGINEGMLPQHLKPSFKSGRSTLSVWGAISYQHKGPLFVIPKGQRMNGEFYRNNVLGPIGVPFYQKHVEESGAAVWQQDSAPCHTAKATKDYMESKGLHIMDWPPQSPDLNPIENIWGIMKQNISKRRHKVTTLPQMEQAVKEEWDNITQEEIQKVIDSMGERVDKLISVKGASLHY